MELAVAVSAHPDRPEVIRDSVESILAHATDKILCVVDGVAWDRYRRVDLPCDKLEGFPYGCRQPPYRNVAMALSVLTERWPGADWYAYSDYDVLFASDRFRHNLRMAAERGVWMLGNDGHVDEQGLPLVQAIVGEPLRRSYYLLGCLHFFHRDFMSRLLEINFFERFLTMTAGCGNGPFPLYTGYDLSEHMYPSLCRHFGGHIGVFASYDAAAGEWHGAYRHYPMRWRPELDPESEHFPEASILHPLKAVDHPIRAYHRERRQRCKISGTKARPSGSY